MKKVLSFILARLLLFGAGNGIVSAASGAAEGFNNAPHHSWNWKEVKDRCLSLMSAYWNSDDESVRDEKKFDRHHSKMGENHDKHHARYNHPDGSHHRHHGKMHHGHRMGR